MKFNSLILLALVLLVSVHGLNHAYSYYGDNSADTPRKLQSQSPKLEKQSFIEKSESYSFLKQNTTNTTVETHPGIFPKNSTLNFVVNLNLDMKAKKTFVRYLKCKEKAGLLYHLKSENGGLSLKPVLAVLNQNSFVIQDNEIPQSLILGILLTKIERVGQTFRGTTCFDLIEEKKESSPLQLCAETKDEMDDWVVGLLEFKECLLKEKFEIIDANSNAFAKKQFPNPGAPPAPKTPSKEDIQVGKGTVPPPQPPTPPPANPAVETPPKPVVIPDAMYYTNTFAPQSETTELTETNETLTRILNNRKREEIAQRQIKRQVEDKIRAVKEAHKKILLQERAMAKKNAANKKKEIAAETLKIETQSKKVENKILNDTMKKMDKMNKQDLDEYTVTISKPIIEEKKRTRSQVQRIMKMAEANNVNQPFDECLDNKLEGFKDLKYVKDVCQKMFGEDLCETCEQKENFCQKCCTHRIGRQYVNKLAKCKVQCNNLIN